MINCPLRKRGLFWLRETTSLQISKNKFLLRMREKAPHFVANIAFSSILVQC